jgi:hypothetical protein
MKKVIYRYLSGFSFGVMMLALGYCLAYCIGGENYYASELATIFNVRTLLTQIVWSGIFYCVLSITVVNTHDFLSKEKNDVTFQFLLMFVVHCIVLILVAVFTQKFGNFSAGIYSLLFGIGLIILILATVADMAQNAWKYHRTIQMKKSIKYEEELRSQIKAELREELKEELSTLKTKKSKIVKTDK